MVLDHNAQGIRMDPQGERIPIPEAQIVQDISDIPELDVLPPPLKKETLAGMDWQKAADKLSSKKTHPDLAAKIKELEKQKDEVKKMYTEKPIETDAEKIKKSDDVVRRAEQLLPRIVELKDAGNALFKSDDAKAAIAKYEDAIKQMAAADINRETIHAGRARMAGANEALLSLHNNAAAAQLRLEQWEAAASSASAALGLDPTNSKALFRRGVARNKLGQLASAHDDLKAACRADPKNRTARAELAAVQAAVKAQRGGERASWAANLSANLGSEKELARQEEQEAARKREQERVWEKEAPTKNAYTEHIADKALKESMEEQKKVEDELGEHVARLARLDEDSDDEPDLPTQFGIDFDRMTDDAQEAATSQEALDKLSRENMIR